MAIEVCGVVDAKWFDVPLCSSGFVFWCSGGFVFWCSGGFVFWCSGGLVAAEGNGVNKDLSDIHIVLGRASTALTCGRSGFRRL
ncbi:hypothetical protein OAG82_03395 [Rubripirellula sp.]|nr:hypothetical protein [Rubripirellula sp.]MDB4621883.1 hypothetical protein [Rubripirellula sp.]